MTFEFIVYGAPFGQPRMRARAFTTKEGNATVGFFEPQTIKTKEGFRKPNPIYEWKQKVRAAALDSMGFTEADLNAGKVQLLTGALKIDGDFYFPRTKELEKAKYPDRIWHTKKPDRDNCDKGVLDALKGTMIADDCAVCTGTINKWYIEHTGRPRAEIRVTQLHEDNAVVSARAKGKKL